MALNRREFLQKSASAAAGLAALSAAPAAPAEQKSMRPNLLIIHTDQLSSWALSAYAPRLARTPNYGRTVVKTLHIDRIGQEGAVLTNFFTNSAVCTPSRGCLFTGRYPHCHGAYRNNIELNPDEITIARVLKRHGYATGYSGKWHLDGPPKPGFLRPERSMGFDDCRYMFNRGHWKKIIDLPNGGAKVFPYKVIGDKKTFTTDWLADKTIAFITRQRTKPFFYVVSIPDPHGPFTVRAPYMTMYRPEGMPVPKTFRPAQGRKAKGRKRTAARLRRTKAQYCGLVKCIDDNVGRILNALEKKGILDDTIIVFTTDHGEYMGEHGLYGKNQWYRTAYQIPFLIRWPKKIPAGLVLDRFVTNVDVQQSLLGLMGIKPCGREQGRDASALLRGEKIDWKDAAWIHHSSLKSAGIFTPKWELVLKASGAHVLFDRENDPEQVRNLATNPADKKVLAKLARQVIEHHRELKSPAMAWLET